MELALALPLLVVLLLGVVQVAVVVRDQLAVQLAAREGARAAAVSRSPREAATAAAVRAVDVAPLDIAVSTHAGLVTVTVTLRERTDVPLIGALLPDVTLQATVTMALEPP